MCAETLSTNASVVSAERNDSFVFNDSLEILDGFKKVLTLASIGSLHSVLEMHAHIISSGLGSYKK